MHYADPTRCLPGRDFDRNTLGVTADGKTEASSVDAALGVMTMDAAARFLDVWTPPREIVNSQQTVRDSAFDFVAKFTLYAIMVCPLSSYRLYPSTDEFLTIYSNGMPMQ